MKKDIYDEAVEYLSVVEDGRFFDTWVSPLTDPGGVLFLFCSDSGDRLPLKSDSVCGCLTGVKANYCPAQTKRITDAIRKDIRLPGHQTLITQESLPVFAEWQRKLDKAFPGRGKSVHEIARESIKATREALKARKRKAAK